MYVHVNDNTQKLLRSQCMMNDLAVGMNRPAGVGSRVNLPPCVASKQKT